MLSNLTGTSNSASFSNSLYKVFGHAAVSEINKQTHAAVSEINKQTHTDTWFTNKNTVKQNTEYSSSFPQNWKWQQLSPFFWGSKKFKFH